MIRASLTCAALLAVLLNVAHGRQAPPSPAAKPLVPAAASSIAAAPDAFIGQQVSVTAAVDRILSPTTFTIDQDVRRSGAGDVVVLVESLIGPLSVNAYVTVIGEVVRHEGRAAIRATSVLSSAMIDLAKRPPVPLTAEEQAFDQAMKRINPAFAAVREAVAAGSGEVRAHTAALTQAFAETAAFWKKRDKADAVKWAADAQSHAVALERAAAAGKWDDAKTAVTGLQQTCSACHGAYRQRGDDGYRIRLDK